MTAARLGLDPARLAYGLRTAAAAAAALWLAWRLGLEHPQWAGMTVWASSQPVRAHLVEKSAFRAVGTLVGAAIGLLLAVLAARTGWGPAVLVPGVALWLGLCAGAGNLLRGFASYGAMLAGYSAVMVALLDSGRPDSVLALGLDRSATVLVGVATALVIGLAFTPSGTEAEIPRRLRLAGARILRQVAAELRAPGGGDPAEPARILSELARLDDEIDAEAAGSVAARREARNRREAIMAQVAAILWLRTPGTRPQPGRAAAVDAVAAAYEAHAAAAGRRAALARAARGADPELRGVLVELGAALPRAEQATAAAAIAPAPLALHRDWAAAREAAVRAAATMLFVGAIWAATGWTAGPLMMLGSAIMLTVFSTFDDPFAILPKVAAGQAMGAAAAIACRWLLWPQMGGEAGLLAATLPFIFLGGVLTGVPRLQAQAFDYNMVVLLLLQPVWPLAGSFPHSLMVGAAVAVGPLVALAAFRLIHPPSAARRRNALLRAMIADIEAMAARPAAGPLAARPAAGRRAALWRPRLHHRLLRLVRWSDRLGADAAAAAAGGLALLRVGQALARIDAALADPAAGDGDRRRLRVARRRVATLGRDPHRAADALAAAAARGGRDAALLRSAAEAVRASAGFLAAAARP